MVKIHKGCCSNYSRLMRVLQTHYPSQRPAKNKVSGGKQNYPKVIRWSSFSPAQPSPPPKKSGVEKGKELPRLVSQLTAICCDYNSSNKKLLILRWEVYTERNSFDYRSFDWHLKVGRSNHSIFKCYILILINNNISYHVHSAFLHSGIFKIGVTIK